MVPAQALPYLPFKVHRLQLSSNLLLGKDARAQLADEALPPDQLQVPLDNDGLSGQNFLKLESRILVYAVPPL